VVKKKGRYPVLLLAAGILCTGLLIHTYPPGWGGVVRAAVREQAERRRRQREQSVEQERPMTDCSCWHFTGMAPSRSIHMKASDTLAGEQWALSNDGTFQMEDEQNRFPVFDRPFTQPSAPGHWQRPQQGMSGSAPWGTSGNMPSGTPQNTFPGVRGITPGKNGSCRDAGSGICRISRSRNHIRGKCGCRGGSSGRDRYKRGGSLGFIREGNREVVIALIDTGVDISHQELSGSIWINEDEISGNGIEIRHP